MMDPPVTNSPEKTFTPKRCEFESRPFFELPKPFLCAIRVSFHPSGLYRLLTNDFLNFHTSEVLAVTDGALILLLALELEDKNLVATSMLGNLSANLRGPDRIAHNQLIGVV